MGVFPRAEFELRFFVYSGNVRSQLCQARYGLRNKFVAMGYIDYRHIVKRTRAAGVRQSLRKVYAKVKEKTWFFWVDFAVQIALFGLSVVLLVNNTFNPFIYFQF